MRSLVTLVFLLTNVYCFSQLNKEYLNTALYYASIYNKDSAVVYFNLALNKYRQEKNQLFELFTIEDLGHFHENLNQKNEALKYFKQADKLYYSLNSETNISSEDKLYMKYLMSFNRKQFDKAIYFGLGYLKLKSQKYSIYNILNQIAFSLYQLRNYEESNKYYHQALQILLNKKNQPGQLNYVLTCIALNYHNLGNFDKAIQYYLEADKYADILNLQTEKSRINTGLGACYYEKHDYERSIESYQIALKCKNNEFLLAAIYTGISDSYAMLMDKKSANLYYEQSLNEINKGGGYFDKFEFLMSYGTFLSNYEKIVHAERIFIYALGLLFKEKSNDKSKFTRCNTNLGNFYLQTGNYYLSLNYYQNALLYLSPGFVPANLYVNPRYNPVNTYSYYFPILKGKAKALYALYKKTNSRKYLQHSLETFELLCAEIEKQRAGFASREDKVFITERYSEIFGSALNAAYEMYRITGQHEYKERALKLAERSKSTIMLESLHENEAKSFAGVPASIREKEIELKRNIAAFEKILYEEKSKSQSVERIVNYWTEALANAKTSLDTLNTQIRENYSTYYRLKYNPSQISSSEIQNKLERNQALLEYTIADTSIYIFVVTKSGFEVFRKPYSKHLMSAYTKLFNLSGIVSGGSDNVKKYTNTSFEVYANLLKPAEYMLTGVEELIIVPDQKIANISFEALVDSKPTRTAATFKELPFLIKRFTIGYAEQATLYMKKHERVLSNAILAMAPDYSSGEFQQQREVRILSTRGYNLQAIPGVVKEVEFLSKFPGTRIFIGKNASEGNFKKCQRRYNILHLAMHAVVDTVNPLYSKFIFSKAQQPGEDGFLNTSELMNMNMGADLAVLSACNTGAGKVVAGEGVMNLARGFFYAGCKSVIMTLWPAADYSSCGLVQNFYDYFTQGYSKPEALRLAKLDYLKKANGFEEHPFFWAAYVNIGEPHPLYKKSISVYLYIAIGAFLIILVVGILVVRKKIRARNRDNYRINRVYLSDKPSGRLQIF